jgi:hypothetical protein
MYNQTVRDSIHKTARSLKDISLLKQHHWKVLIVCCNLYTKLSIRSTCNQLPIYSTAYHVRVPWNKIYRVSYYIEYFTADLVTDSYSRDTTKTLNDQIQPKKSKSDLASMLHFIQQEVPQMLKMQESTNARTITSACIKLGIHSVKKRYASCTCATQSLGNA